MNNAKAAGNIGEEAVCRYLAGSGYKIVERNFTVRGGEIDIIAFDRDVLCFIEVRLRGRSSYLSGEESVDREKQRHIIYAAESYLRGLDNVPKCRFDVAAVRQVDKKLYLKYFKNAFDASSK